MCFILCIKDSYDNYLQNQRLVCQPKFEKQKNRSAFAAGFFFQKINFKSSITTFRKALVLFQCFQTTL